ncbi:MAG: hypothetical protein AAFX55_01510 [Bacteroidota bacterium]
MKTKVKALTLNEMVIVMIITSIVVGLAFTVLSLVQRHMWSIQQNFNLNTEFNRLEEVLWVDCNHYNTLILDSQNHKLRFKTALDSTVYRFEKDYVLKDRDTFNISIAQKTLYFKGKEIAAGPFDALRLQLSKARQDQQIFIFKTNDAKHLMD